MTTIVNGHGADVDGQDTYVPDGVTWWVGTDIPDGTRLCSDPQGCQAPAAHTCTGVLGLVDDTDIAILACRGVAGQQGADVHTPTAYDQTSIDFRTRALQYLTQVETGDEVQVAEAEAAVDALGQDEIALLITTFDFQNWLRARWVKEYALSNDLEQLFGQLTSNTADLAYVMPWLNTVPSYGAALDAVATTYPETFLQWLAQANDTVRAALVARPAIAGITQD